MKATIMGNVLPFEVPGHVYLSTDIGAPPAPAPGATPQPWGSQPVPAPSYVPNLNVPLQMVAADTLEAMCDDFREAVFSKAMKARPPLPLNSYSPVPYETATTALSLLKDILADPEGRVRIGTDRDSRIIQDSLLTLKTFFDSLA